MDRYDLERWLERYPPPSKLKDEDDGASQRAVAPRNLRIERSIDLHGLTVAEAQQLLSEFVLRAARERVRKILVVHGKGSHPGSQGALRKMVVSYLNDSPVIGATGNPGAAEGGSGATWAIVRQRSR